MAEIIDFDQKERQLEQAKKKEHSEVAGDTPQSFMKCEGCGGVRFNQIFVLRIVTPFEDSELIEDQIAPIPLFECMQCKRVVNVF